MSIRNLSNAITSRAGRQLLKAQKHSPAILFTAGVIGVVAATVLACKATLNLHDVLDEHEKEIEAAKIIDDRLMQHTEEDHKKNVALIHARTGIKIVKMYAPAVVVGGLSIAALTGSHVVLNRRYAGVAAAYAALDKGFKEYRDRVKERFGEEADRDLRYGSEYKEIVEETNQGPKVSTVKRAKPGSASIYARYFDNGSRNWQSSPGMNANFLAQQQIFLNQKLQANGHLFLNEVYEALDLPRTREGSVVGWLANSHETGKGDGFVDFSDAIINGETQDARDFFNGANKAILLDFNVDGVIWDLI